MPTAGRNQRREQRAENLRRWAAYVTRAMAEAGVQPKDVVNASEGAIDKGSLSHWMNEENPASAEGALTFARILKREPAEALREAGHQALADAVEDPRLARIRAASMSETEMAVLEKEYLSQLAELDARIAQRVARQSTAREGEDEEKDENAL